MVQIEGNVGGKKETVLYIFNSSGCVAAAFASVLLAASCTEDVAMVTGVTCTDGSGVVGATAAGVIAVKPE